MAELKDIKLDMTEEEYRKHPALNFSKLASYYNEGVYSPDHALMDYEFKSYFEYGKMFETLLQDTVKGTDDFSQRFFFSNASGQMPDKLIEWIDTGEQLSDKYKLNKNGSRSKSSRTLHGFLDEAQGNPGKIPVSQQDAELLKMHVERMIKMSYLNVRVGDLLAKAEWQVPIIWLDEYDGLQKKALLDCIVDLGGEYLVLDIKTAASFIRFSMMLRKKYWIQDIHYIEGVNQFIGPSMQMIFLVASKEAPFLCQPWSLDYGDMDWRINAIEEYRELCESFAAWDGNPRGWLPMGTQKLYLQQKQRG